MWRREDPWQAKFPPAAKPRRSRRHTTAKPKLESLLDSPPQSVEVIKPKRKPRSEKRRGRGLALGSGRPSVAASEEHQA